jgi:hypothetical protein
MNTKTTTMMLGIMAVVAIAMLFAAGPLITDHQAFARYGHNHSNNHNSHSGEHRSHYHNRG